MADIDLTTSTVPLVVTGLAGGFLVARLSRVRMLGGVVFALAGLVAGKKWGDRKGAGTATLLGTLYTAGLVGSHPLAKKVGAWPSVALVTAAVAAAAHTLGDE